MVVDGMVVNDGLNGIAGDGFGGDGRAVRDDVRKGRRPRHRKSRGHQSCARYGFLQHDGLTFRLVRDAYDHDPSKVGHKASPSVPASVSLRPGHNCIKISRKTSPTLPEKLAKMCRQALLSVGDASRLRQQRGHVLRRRLTGGIRLLMEPTIYRG